MTTALLEREKLITGEELLAMLGMECAELIDGVIKGWPVQGGEHGYLEVEIGGELRNFSKKQKLGRVMAGETGVYIRQYPDRVRKFDVGFISRERLPQRPPMKYLDVAPEVVVEIMSPTDRWNSDLREEIEDYFSIGVEEVWVVEPARESVRRYFSADHYETLEDDDELHGNGVLAGFSLKIADLFSEE